jgi:PAS domain-containing protein
MEILTRWWLVYPLALAFKAGWAAISVSTAFLFRRQTPSLAGNVPPGNDSPAREPREAEEDGIYRSQIEAFHRSQMIVEFRLDGTIIKANDNFLRTFGYQDAELAGKHLRQRRMQAKY